MVVFAGEKYLTNAIPDTESERSNLLRLMILSTVMCIVVIPRYIVKFVRVLHKSNQNSPQQKDSSESIYPLNKYSKVKTSISTKKKKSKVTTKVRTIVTTTTSSGRTIDSQRKKGSDIDFSKNETNTLPPSSEIHPFILPILNLIWLTSIIYLILISSNNTFNARSTFQAPLFTPSECKTIIQMAEKAAKLNYENSTNSNSPLTDIQQKHLQAPKGWHKSRHSHYPTTDLNLVSDPFAEEDLQYLANIFNARLAPLIERIYGVTPLALRAKDIFVVRYNADNQSYLQRHTDSGDISFNILLNNDFTGGGTRFWNRATEESYIINPSPGEVILSNAMIDHEGLKITSGIRYILVGFISVDNVDPFTKEATGLSLFASWLSMIWVLNRAKAGYLSSKDRMVKNAQHTYYSTGQLRSSLIDNKYGQALFSDYYKIALEYGDLWAPHSHVRLIDNDHIFEKYIHAMDLSYHEQVNNMGKTSVRGPSWFRAQQLELDLDDSFVRHSNDILENKDLDF